MADKKPFIAARLRNPAEEAAAKKKTPAKTDWIGGACAIVAFALAAATAAFLWLDFDTLTTFIGK